MKLIPLLATALAAGVVCTAIAFAADPVEPVLWTAAQMKAADQKAAGRVDPARHVGVERLMDSAFIVHRDGPSEAEAHAAQADFFVMREGEGILIVGGKMVNPRTEREGELRSATLEGGKRIAMKAGDTLYIPANTPHIFTVEPGKQFTATIIKVTPVK